MFLEFLQEEDHSIILSSHITSDLDKIADTIALIDHGKLLFHEEKDALRDGYSLIKGSAEQLAELDRQELVGVRENRFGFEALCRREIARRHPGLASERPDIEQIMPERTGMWMKGLLYKDLALMGRQAKLMLLYILVFGVVFMGFMGNTSFALSFISLMMFMFSINCFAYDEQASFDKLTAAAPVPKRAVVLARYLSSLIIWIAGTAGIALVGFVAQVVKAGGALPDWSGEWPTLVASFALVLLFMAVLFPILYRFGSTKSRLVLILVCCVPVFAVGAVIGVIQDGQTTLPALPPAFLSTLPYFAAAILLLGLLLSFSLSVRILERKEY